MLRNKGMLVSLDLLVSLPVISASLLLIYHGLAGGLLQVQAIAKSQTATLNLYEKSQVAILLSQQATLNLSGFSLYLSYLNSGGLNFSLIAQYPNFTCPYSSVCRIIVLRGKAYFMVAK
ncbi:MAG: hypothetical protein KGH61_03275 [Candidatus Micrarchaeota archaeon]|nr:hypothetical protein [Candidatus Micrarchaeota archaeon]MDE1847945.1 hypothetical protein [Candidatus Micrarchaeota archaeon]MDE1864338.1 hypothetical protein [Candidatus Micrarchaeota archaeon]